MTSNLQHGSISSFPMELLHEIAKLQVLTSSLPAFRLVCRSFNAAATPHMFSKVTISYKDGKQEQFFDILESLASGAHPGILYAKSLNIGYFGPFHNPLLMLSRNEKEKYDYMKYISEVVDPYCAHSTSIQKWFSRGIIKLSQVTSIRWNMDYRRSFDWSRDCVITGISQMKSLTSFEVSADIKSGAYINLSTIPPVEVISVFMLDRTSLYGEDAIGGIPDLIQKSSARLRRIRVTVQDPQLISGDMPLLSYLLQKVDRMPSLKSLSLEDDEITLNKADIVKLESLESLHVNNMHRHRRAFPWPGANNDDGARSTRDIWLLLKNKQLHLKEITISEPNKFFVEYLHSYTGLHTLTITSARNSSPGESDTLANKFYSEALSKHAQSLQKLVVKPEYEGKWCFGGHCIDTLAGLVNLRHLTISIVAKPSETTNTNPEYDIGYESAMIESKCEYDPFHPVCQVLKMATSLPKLELLSINGASHSSNHRWDNFTSNHHKIIPKVQIYVNVTSFEPLDPSRYRFNVEISGVYLYPRMVEELGGYRYRRIYSN